MSHTVFRPYPHRADVQRSWLAVAVLPIILVIGFVLGSNLLGDPNEPSSPHGWDGAWRVVLLWVCVAAAPVLGAFWGGRAVRSHDRAGRAPMVVNVIVFLLLTATTLVGGLSDTLR